VRFKNVVALLSLLLLLGVPPFCGGSNPSDSSASDSAVAASPEPAVAPEPSPAPSPVASGSMIYSLLDLMVTKGVLSSAEVASLKAAPANVQMSQMLALLKAKGLLSDADLAAMNHPTNAFAASYAGPVASNYSSSGTAAPMLVAEAVAPNSMAAETQAGKPPGPTVVSAVAPVRVLPVDAPKREGLVPDLKIGPVRVKPYGFIKVSAVHDTSQPRGDDFPLPQFIFNGNGDTGPNKSPEFHIKARATRFGSNFEWVDVSPKLTITGRVEADFEGNFSATDNRNVSSIRSNAFQLRLAWARLDYAASDKTDLFAVFGQDWTPFGSSTLPNTLETTGVGIAFGSLYERNPQIRGGFIRNLGGSRNAKWLTEIAAVLPAFGNVPSSSNFQIPGTATGLANNIVTVTGCATPPCGTVTIPTTANTGSGLAEQLGYGERQGADSARPEVEARAVLQFQLDKAPGVAPAQLIVSGVQGERVATVLKANVPAAPTGSGLPANFYQAAFSTGTQVSSDRYGISTQAQLPTRWATFLASYYRGADLRYFFANQLFSFYNNTAAQALTNTVTVPSIDGSAAVVFGNHAGTPTVASQEPIRTAGGFAEVGLPLSRWFNVNPSSRMAGWTMNLHYGIDQAVARDVRKAAPGGARQKSDWTFGNVQYKMNTWVTFAFEEALYRTRAIPNATTGAFTGTVWKGFPTREANDVRSEFATIFTF